MAWSSFMMQANGGFRAADGFLLRDLHRILGNGLLNLEDDGQEEGQAKEEFCCGCHGSCHFVK